MYRVIAAILWSALAIASPAEAIAQSNSAEQALEADFDRGYRLQKQGRFKEAAAMDEIAGQRLPEAIHAPPHPDRLWRLSILGRIAAPQESPRGNGE